MTLEYFDIRILFRSIQVEAKQESFSWLRVVLTCRMYAARSRQRKQLRYLGEHQLKDMGISRADALVEASKPFWEE